MISTSDKNLEREIKTLLKHAITIVEDVPYGETIFNNELELHKEGIKIIGKVYEIPDNVIELTLEEIKDAEDSHEYNRDIKFVIEEEMELIDMLNKAINLIECSEENQIIKDLTEYICDFYDVIIE